MNGAAKYTAEDIPGASIIMHCPRPGCTHSVETATDWEAVHLIGEHIIQVHVQPIWTRREFQS